ncbi:MAG: carboxysome shell carbonic anhydrase [Gammaproteobacteria bacterium]|nr:carboxysome shell carbonic anhydrase [Gammaproteobacteria bacterium]
MLRRPAQARPAFNRAPCRRPGSCNTADEVTQSPADITSGHPLSNGRENERLYRYENRVKTAFDEIVPVLKKISAQQHETDFEQQAQRIAKSELGFELPEEILANAWVDQLDMRRLFAWSVFETYRRFTDEFYTQAPLAQDDESGFDDFIQSCGFHTIDVSPCADGRLAHVIRYVLRMPYRKVRRKSYAGAMFDIDNSVEKWVETEMLRFREGKPNTADKPTRYLKVVAYHYSSVDPLHEGCAAHGSDTQKAAEGGLERLETFKTAVENNFCCGASIDLLLIGLDTDTDSMRVHVPDMDGVIHLDRFVDTLDVYKVTQYGSETEGSDFIANQIRSCSPEVLEGTAKFAAYLIENNLSQIDYVRKNYGDAYPDTGHAERFIGAGIGFEEIQLRNLMYFAYLTTVEEAVADTDVGIKIFTGLNVNKGLPVPIVVRFDYHGQVPGARDRAQQHCERVTRALNERYADLAGQGMLHIMQVVRDCNANAPIEVLGCSVKPKDDGGH